jgi:SapC
MNRTVLLDNIAHADLRVRTGYSAELGDSINNVLVFPTEFVYLQREYPILFRRDGGGSLQAVALLGFDKDENLFLTGQRWDARYVPAVQQRGPFLIGFRQNESAGQVVREPVIHVHLDHPRISRTEGEPVFLAHGGNSPYLDHANRMLQIIYKGTAAMAPMFAAFEQAGLIEPMQIDVQLDDRVKYSLPGFLSISEQRLASLDGAQLERLNKPGYLHFAMFVLASMGNMNWLIELKNRKRAASVARESVAPGKSVG